MIPWIWCPNDVLLWVHPLLKGTNLGTWVDFYESKRYTKTA